MSLSDLFSDLGIAAPNEWVTDISSNSRHAAAGGLFLASAGLNAHGLDYLDDALAKRIKAVAWEPVSGIAEPKLPATVIGIRVPELSKRAGQLADRFFAHPSASLAVTGITGTNGKTTTAWLAAQAMNKLGLKCAYTGTLGYSLGLNTGSEPGTDLQDTSLTTPGVVTMHRRLQQMRAAGAQHVMAEVSSHGLDQGRVDSVRFRVAALTNLSRDHLDYHGSMQRYAEAKTRLFIGTGIQTAVINVGDAFGTSLARQLEPATRLMSVALVDTDNNVEPSTHSIEPKLRGRIVSERRDGIGLQLSGDFGDATIESPLWGRFNAENLALAVGILLANDVPFEQAVDALTTAVAPPGRMEIIQGSAGRADQGQPTVVVDFAHTPDALQKALITARAHTDGAVWCVFGCGGDRDRGKRGSMGAVAQSYADRTVVTDDNPRTENPAQIASDIIAGAGADNSIIVIHDRANAIAESIQSAAANDVVLIAGKGHETVQWIGAEAHPFSDSNVARAALGGVV